MKLLEPALGVAVATLIIGWYFWLIGPILLAPARPAQNSPATVEQEHIHLGKCPECAKAFDQGLERKVKRMVDEQMRSRFNVLGVGSKLPRVKK